MSNFDLAKATADVMRKRNIGHSAARSVLGSGKKEELSRINAVIRGYAALSGDKFRAAQSLRNRYDALMGRGSFDEAMDHFTKNIDQFTKTSSLNIGNLKIKFVDGTKVRNELFTDFTQAGHGFVYKFIPKDEIWIEKDLPPGDLKPTLMHEIRERRLMREKGMTYDEAHEKVTELEAEERGGQADDDNAYTENS